MTPGPPKQFDRDEALRRALQLFWAKGYDAVGVTDLLEEMRIGRQSMYDTFGNKHDLFLAALGAYVERQVTSVRGVLGGAGSPLGRIDAAFNYWKQLVSQGQGCFAGNSFSELGPRDPEVGRVLEGGMTKIVGAFRDTLQEAIDVGELRPDTDVEGLADLILTTGQGVALLTQIDSCCDFALRGWSHLEAIIDRYRTEPAGVSAGAR